MDLSLHQVTKRLGDRPVLQGLDLEIQAGELFFVLGPSGGGKTTLLRLVAGFLEPDSGEIRFAGRSAQHQPAHDRPTALVFQQPALWPHLSVAENLGYGLDVRGIREPERSRRIAAALATVRLPDLGHRRSTELSGGQQQRVALARALVIQPSVLLLDEPLSNLEPGLRADLRDEIRRIHTETRLTMVYVTHDRQEALALAERAAVLHEGRIEQVADPETLYHRPRTRFVADFLGEMNWRPGAVCGRDAVSLEIQTDLGRLRAAWEGPAPAESVWVGFRPRHLHPGSRAANSFSALVRRRTCAGEYDEWVMEAPDGHLLVLHQSNLPVNWARGEVVTVSVRPGDLRIFPRS